MVPGDNYQLEQLLREVWHRGYDNLDGNNTEDIAEAHGLVLAGLDEIVGPAAAAANDVTGVCTPDCTEWCGLDHINAERARIRKALDIER